MLPIYVISLPAARARRERAAAQLARFDLDFEFFDALDGDSGSGCFRRIDEERFVLHTGRETTPGEIGCFASHKQLWQRCIDENRPILVMEDDFELESGFADAVRAAGQLINELDFIRLQDERRGASKPLMNYRGFTIERYTKTPHCAMCYAITPRIAKRWMKLFEDFYAPVDVVLKHVWLFDNPMYCLTPYTVRSGDLSMSSMIGERAKCGKCLRTRLRRTGLKVQWQVRRLLFNLARSDHEILKRCTDSKLRRSLESCAVGRRLASDQDA